MSLEERFTITLTEEEWKALKKELEAAERAVKDAKALRQAGDFGSALYNLTYAMDRVLSIVLLLIRRGIET